MAIRIIWEGQRWVPPVPQSSIDAFEPLLSAHELGDRHLALVFVVDVAGTPQSEHAPIAALDSRRLRCRTPRAGVALACMIRRHDLDDFYRQHVLHDGHSVTLCPRIDKPIVRGSGTEVCSLANVPSHVARGALPQRRGSYFTVATRGRLRHDRKRFVMATWRRRAGDGQIPS